MLQNLKPEKAASRLQPSKGDFLNQKSALSHQHYGGSAAMSSRIFQIFN
jgi:hypothetical protein